MSSKPPVISSKPPEVKIIADEKPAAENKIIQDFLQKPFDSSQTINAERGFKRLTHANDIALTKHYTDPKTKKCKAALGNIPLFETSNVEETCRLANTITIKCPAIIKGFLPLDLRTILANFKDEKISYFISSQNLPSKSMPVYFRPNHWMCGLQPLVDNQIAAGVYNKEMAYSTCTTQFFSYTSNEIAIKNPTQRDIRIYSYPVNVASPSMVVCETPSDPRVSGITAGINFENSQHVISLAVTTDRSVAVTFHLILNSADQKSLNEISQRVSNLAALIVELEKLGNTSKLNAPNGPMSALRRFLNIPTLNCQLLAGHYPQNILPVNGNAADVKISKDANPGLPAGMQRMATITPQDLKKIADAKKLNGNPAGMVTIKPVNIKPIESKSDTPQPNLTPKNIVPALIDPNDLNKDGLLKLSNNPEEMKKQLEEIERQSAFCKARGKGMKIKRYYTRDGKIRDCMKALEKKNPTSFTLEEKCALDLKLRFSVVIDAMGISRILYIGKDRILGKGAAGIVKHDQNLNTKKIDVVKISKGNNSLAAYGKEETKMAEKTKLSQGEYTRTDERGLVLRQYRFHKYAGQHDLYFLTALDADSIAFRNQYNGRKRKKENFIGTLGERINIAIQFFKKLITMHRVQKILHRDLKSENIVYDQNTKELTIVDLGLAKELPPDGKLFEPVQCGTPYAMAPEIINPVIVINLLNGSLEAMSEYSEATDIYAAGTILMDLFGTDYRFHGGDKYVRDPKILTMVNHSNPDVQKVRLKALTELEKIIQAMTDNKAVPRKIITAEAALNAILKVKEELDKEINRIFKKNSLKKV